MARAVIAVIAGFVAWTILWLGGSFAGVAIKPDAFDEAGMTADTTMLGAFVVLSVVCSLIAGALCARVSRRPGQRARPGPVVALSVLLLLVGVGVQASAWDAMPLWYHLTFLALLIPAPLAGGHLARGGAPS